MVLHHLIVIDAPAECEAEPDRVAGGKMIKTIGLLVGGFGLLLNLLQEGILRVLSDVAVEVANLTEEEGLSLVRAGATQDMVVDHGDDFLAVSAELLLDLALVVPKCGIELGVFWVRFYGRDCTDGGSLGRNKVLEGHGE